MKHLMGAMLGLSVLLWVGSAVAGEIGQLAQRDVSVNGYTRSDGRYVQPHHQTAPDGNPYNNYGYPGNYNPNTGTISGGNPDTYLRNRGGGGSGLYSSPYGSPRR
jgi:hypothetical protein